MKLLLSIMVFLFLLSSIVLGQEYYPRMLSPVDLSQGLRSEPGAIPQSTMRVDTLVNSILQQVNLDSLVAYVRILSGEDSLQIGGSRVPIQKRGTYAGGNLAADYLVERLGSCNLEVHDESYSAYGRNVYAVQYGYLYPEKQYILCAHYDAVSQYGADDDASGVAVVLEAARILTQYDFKYTLVYALWDEEEDGYLGSKDYASRISSEQAQIQGVLNLDMLGWDSNQDGLAEVHTQNTVNSGRLANMLLIVNSLYGLALRPVVYNPGMGEGDQSAFWDYSWGAVLLGEARYGGDLNPHDHSVEDRIDKFNLPYFHTMAKLSIGAVVTLIEVTKGPLIASVVPAVGYRTYAANVQIKGVKTHFQEDPGATKVWLSNDQETLVAECVVVNSNTSLDAWFSIPSSATVGMWDVNVENPTDGITTKAEGFNILPPPAIIAVSPESLSVTLAKGRTQEYHLTISNTGGTELCFTCSVAEGLGSPNYALQFDGQHSYVDCGNKASLNVRHSITMEAWIYALDLAGGNRRILQKGHEDWQYRFLAEFGSFVVDLAGVTGGRLECQLPSTNTWHHVAAVYDYEHHRIALYEDGSLIAAQTASGEIAVSSDPLVIGLKRGDIDVPGDNWYGMLDEVRIWNVARSDTDIRRFMDRRMEGTEPGLVGYWPFDEGTGAVAFDKTANANNGVLWGGVAWMTSAPPLAPGWLSLISDSGICACHSSVDIGIFFDATKVDAGEYRSSLTIKHNDPMKTALTIPIYLVVSPEVDVRDRAAVPDIYSLFQNYPNPFNPSTTIRYALPSRSHVSLAIYNTLGQKARTLVDEVVEAGYHSAEFDASGLASGVYLYRLQAGDFVSVKKLMVLK